MRNFKKLSALVVAIALVLTSIVPAFAYTPVNADKAEALRQLEIYQGISTDSFVPALDQDLTRGQGALLLARLFNKEADIEKMTDAEATAILKAFADGGTVPAYAKKAVAYFADKKVINGSLNNGELNIDEAGSLYAEQFAALVLRQMGYQDSHYTKALEELAAVDGVVGLDSYVSVVGSEIKRDHAVGIMYGSLTGKYEGDTATVISKIVEAKPALKEVAEKLGLIKVEVKALEVESVKALNLREVEVKFNKAVVADEAKKLANYTINSKPVAKVELAEDAKSVILTTTHANAMSNYSTDVKVKILKAVGFDADKTISAIEAKDVTVPSMVSVEITGPKNLKVTFSEPLDENIPDADVVNSFKLDNGLMALDTSAVDFDGRVITLKALSTFTEGSHKLEVRNDANNKLVDSASYKVTPNSVTFNYVKDTSPLTAQVVNSTETTVEIKFNKVIDPSTLSANVLFRHTYNTDTNQMTVSASDLKSDGQTLVVDFGSGKPFPPGTTNLYIKYANTDTAIKDYYGNKLPETTLTVTTSADITKPEVTKVEFVDMNTIEVSFSEVVKDTSAENKANYSLKDSTGEVYTITSAAFKTDSKSIVVLKTAVMNGGSYVLTVKNIVDQSIAANKMDDAAISFTAVDKVPPTVNTVKQIGSKKIKVFFSEIMDAATIVDKANWKLNTDALDKNATIEAVDSNKAVIITLERALGVEEDGIYIKDEKLTLARVKDAAGNWTDKFSEEFKIEKLKNIAPSKVEMTATNKIALTFEKEVISGVTTADFEVSYNDGSTFAEKVVGLTVNVVDGNTIIEVLTEGKVNNTTAAGVKIQTKDGAATTGAKNQYETPLQFPATTAKDKVAAAIDTVTAEKDEDNRITKITVTYTEELYVASVTDSDFKVDNREIESVSVSGNKVIIKLVTKTGTTPDADSNVKVTQVGEVEDLLRNVTKAQAAKAISSITPEA